MPQTTISQFQEGQQFDGDLLVKKLNFATTKSDKSYASIDFQDPTGVINGKMWDVTADDLDFAPADVVMVNAVVDSYHDKMQLNIKEIHKLADDDAFNKPEYYLAHAPINNESLKKYIQGQIDTVTTNNPEYGLLLDQLINHNEFSTNDFYTQPAASSLHHAFVGGLAYHVLRMCRHANALCQIYSGLNHDLLVTATIIHDVGKMRELSGYLATDYT
ncbi:hypothetical protein ABTQ33_11870 [Paucilactobacillus suebicus]|uniref:CMP-binding factor n=1 Tax=Paucilactobacillus suebicus DSM 5007 = KCTC 3549 TaxID=1423807 RepID=A0A0R1W1S4_9LACO|nr:CMP-binding factor [Paucilactobacillus suebicus]KRM09433.1 CMP-binding factor [Paucilactobacillus suebicus DSM 5007 = KCTC 3549]